MSDRPKIRLYVDQPLGPGQTVDLSRDQANYLFNVMRLDAGAGVALERRAAVSLASLAM